MSITDIISINFKYFFILLYFTNLTGMDIGHLPDDCSYGLRDVVFYNQCKINKWINNSDETNLIKLVENNSIKDALDFWAYGAIQNNKFQLYKCLSKKVDESALLKHLNTIKERERLFCWATILKNWQMAKHLLLQSNFDITATTNYVSPDLLLMEAFNNINEHVIVEYLKKCTPNLLRDKGSTLLAYAVFSGKNDIIKHLLLLNIDVINNESYFLKNFHYVFKNIDESIIVKYFNDNKKNISSTTTKPILLRYATLGKKMEIAKCLQALDSDITTK